jgi:deoxyribodipyrimidine photolyase-related protein
MPKEQEPRPAHRVRLILGDQLNAAHSWYTERDTHTLYVLMEVRQETDYAWHHVQKVLGFFGAMRRFAEQLRANGHRVLYLTLDDKRNTQSIPDNLRWILARTGAPPGAISCPMNTAWTSSSRTSCGTVRGTGGSGRYRALPHQAR